MKPIIGIVLRPDKNITNKDVQLIYNNVYSALNRCGANVIGIYNEINSTELLSLCNGFILQGGNESTEFDYKLIKYCYDYNIPLLGICLGMQTIGEFFGGKLIKLQNNNHNIIDNSIFHSITIYKNTRLFEILNEYNINVNSRHIYELKCTNLTISARSDDGVIEAIEDSNKSFFIGVEWHPEDIIELDKNNLKIFKDFVQICNKKS